MYWAENTCNVAIQAHCVKVLVISLYVYVTSLSHTVEALISGHPRDVKKVSITGAGHLWDCKNTEFVWGVEKNSVL